MKKHLIGTLLLLSMLLPASFTSALTTIYTYDAAGRLARVEYDIDASIAYAYDVRGNLVLKTVNTAEPAGRPGDINADDNVNLTDVIIVLKLLSGQNPNSTIDASNSIDENSKIGLKEAIYILGEIANSP